MRVILFYQKYTPLVLRREGGMKRVVKGGAGKFRGG